MNERKTETAIVVEDLTVAYDVKPVLWDVDLEIPSGTLTAVIGPNGAGKTTLLKAVLGLIRPISGAVRFPTLETAKRSDRIAYVPQSESVDWDFPVNALDVVMMGRYGRLGWFRRPGAADRAAAMDALEAVGMESFALRQIDQLSGGQQQRIFLARALVQDASIYLMDEPFKGVDARTEKVIVALLQGLRDNGKTVVVVHHDLQTVRGTFDRVALINLHVIDSGPIQTVFHEANLARTYGGKTFLAPVYQGGAA